MRPNYSEHVEVSFGDGVVVLRRTGQSRPIVANVLGVDSDAAGAVSVVYLDRIVHKPKEDAFEGWYVSGAIVTEMRKINILDKKEGSA